MSRDRDGDEVRPPTVPEREGWEPVDRYVETVFELAAARVRGHTVVLADHRLTAAFVEAGLPERPWRFVFATRLEFVPSLVPGVGPASIRPTVTREAERSFAADLRERGFEDVERGRRERVRTETGDRARLRRFTATYRAERPADVEGLLGVWVHKGEFRVAGGAYPVEAPTAEEGARAAVDRRQFREGTLSLLRAVE